MSTPTLDTATRSGATQGATQGDTQGASHDAGTGAVLGTVTFRRVPVTVPHHSPAFDIRLFVCPPAGW